ncbi:MAG: hypothetical protein MJ188_03880 [Treponema sp.]|nr:hypothetical protein [Treponema sp.]
MKQKIILFFLIFAEIFIPFANKSAVFAQTAQVSEISVYNEAFSYFKAGYYPGAVERVEYLEEHYPESVFTVPGLELKSEALIKLGRFEEAVETCKTVILSLHLGSEGFAKSYYLLGKAYYCLQEYSLAVDAFYNACSISLNDKNMEFYNPSILLAGKIYFTLQNYEKAVSPFEYVIANGRFYTPDDYLEVLQKLFISYNQAGAYEKTVKLYENLCDDEKKSQISDEIFSIISMNAADAYEKIHQYKKSYDLYCNLIEDTNFNISVAALKKAYVISSKYNISVNPQEVLAKINNSKNKETDLLAEFWTRLGVDAYNQGNSQEALEFFAYVQNYHHKPSELITFIYETKISLEGIATEFGDNKITDSTAQQKIDILLEKLLENQNAIKTANVNGIGDSYYSCLMNAYFLKGDYGKVQQLYSEIKAPDSFVKYLMAAALYKSKKIVECESFLSDYFEQKNKNADYNQDLLKLYASVLSKRKKMEGASEIYAQLEKEAALKDSVDFNHLEYAKVLYSQKKYKESKVQARKAAAKSDVDGIYLCGLCDFNLGKYESAYEQLSEYRQKAGFVEQAYFYEAFAAYKCADYKKAYNLFSDFANRYSYSLLSVRALDYGAKAAVLTGDLESATVMAKEMIKNSSNEADRFKAAVFCSEVLTTEKKFEEALSILLPYSELNNPRAKEALFHLGIILEKASLPVEADSFYNKVYENYPNTAEAEEALYRSGEVFYSAERWNEAEDRFIKYIYNYVEGKYSEPAYFFSGNCNLKLNRFDKVIMQNTNLIKIWPESSFAYGACKNLLTAYYEVKNYDSALKIAQKIKLDFSKQAEMEGLEIDEKISQLEQILGGMDARLVEKLSDYKKQGAESTLEGRIRGTELVKLYQDFYDSSDKRAFSLAEKLFALQIEEIKKGSDEKLYAAQNAEYLAKYYEGEGKSQIAADMYLKAAEYYRGTEEDSRKSAAMLYSAVGAFMASNLRGDAKATAELLIKLYPETKQAQKVNSLLN